MKTHAKAFSVLEGQTLTSIKHDDAEVTFTTSTGARYIQYHQQDCCESVYIESIEGDINDLLNTPVTLAEETSGDMDSCSESGTWTFYRLGTCKGMVTIRWVGESNGYYSESVDFAQVSP